MIHELSRKDLVSEESGSLTENGKSAAYLHGINYQTSLEQASDYMDELTKIDQELSNDQYNKTLLDRRQALTNSYQDAVKAAQEEKHAIIDLYKQGYEALSNKIKTLTSEYGELLDAERDAFDYQNNISDKTKEIADIRKQLFAYSGDMSEETRTKIQSLTVSLEEAEKDLQETQYDKYISNTKEMLSDLSEDFDDAIQELIDSMTENFDQLITDINHSANDAAQTVADNMTGIGYLPTEHFKNILDESNLAASVSVLAAAIDSFNKDMLKNADDAATSASTQTAAEEADKYSEKTIPKRKAETPNTNSISKKTDLVPSKSNKTKVKGKIATSENYTPDLVPSKSNKTKVKGNVAVSKKHTLEFLEKQTYELTPIDPLTLKNHISFSSLLPSPVLGQTVANNTRNMTVTIDEINLPNVTNYEEFREGLIRDNKFERAVQSMSIDRLSGKSTSFDKLRYLN